jgi:hypothetical protein
MSSPTPQYVTRSLKTLADLIDLTPDPDIRRRARDNHDRLSRKPLEEVLDLIPGDSFQDQAKRCGVTRQTFHAWRNGRLPNRQQAMRIAKLTGLTLAEIRGSSATSAAAARAARVR